QVDAVITSGLLPAQDRKVITSICEKACLRMPSGYWKHEDENKRALHRAGTKRVMKVLGMCTLLFCVMTGEAGATLIIVAVPAVVDRPRCSSNYNQLNAAFSLQLKSVVTQA